MEELKDSYYKAGYCLRKQRELTEEQKLARMMSNTNMEDTESDDEDYEDEGDMSDEDEGDEEMNDDDEIN